jgi:hypothetical protein
LKRASALVGRAQPESDRPSAIGGASSRRVVHEGGAPRPPIRYDTSEIHPERSGFPGASASEDLLQGKPMYTRENPSPEYRHMVEMYATLHREGAESERPKDAKRSAEETFSGKTLLENAPSIRELILRTGSASLLDYGCGKGEVYQQKDLEFPDGSTATTLADYWQLDDIRRYDPGYEPFSELPTDRYDGVICTDVLEHITEPDVPWILEEIFGFARKFVFASIACYPAKKTLPDGNNAHCTVRSPDWWSGLIHGVAMRHTDISYRLHFSTRTGPRKKLGGLYGKRTLEHHWFERRV